MKAYRALLIFVFGIYSLSGCSSTELVSSLYKQGTRPQYKVGNPYAVDGKTYYPAEVASYTEEGQASWYGPGFHGRETANGEEFDTYDMTAAHRTLPMPSIVRVTNLENGRTVYVRVNDRGPFKHNRIIDVSKNAATALGFNNQGTTHVRVEFMPDASRIVAEAAKAGQKMPTEEALERAGMGNGALSPAQFANAAPPANTAIYQTASYTVPVPVISSQTANTEHVLREPVALTVHPATQAGRAAAHAGPMYVQAGAYSSAAHAKMIQKKLANIGAAKIDTVTRDGVRLYCVRLTAHDSITAHHMLEKVTGMGYGTAKIVTD